MTKVRIVIQARMGSSRLPGKILAPLAGEPMLTHVARRLRAAQQYTNQKLEVAVATTTESQDDATERLCQELKVHCSRGDTDDVLARYLHAAADLSADDTVVRATADNPLYCPRRTAAILHEHLAEAADYTCVRNLSYVVPEVMQVEALRRMAKMTSDPDCREHVTPYFRQCLGNSRVRQLPEDWLGLRPDVRLTVDTPEEYERMARVFAALCGRRSVFSLDDAYTYWSFSLNRDPAGERGDFAETRSPVGSRLNEGA